MIMLDGHMLSFHSVMYWARQVESITEKWIGQKKKKKWIGQWENTHLLVIFQAAVKSYCWVLIFVH